MTCLAKYFNSSWKLDYPAIYHTYHSKIFCPKLCKLFAWIFKDKILKSYFEPFEVLNYQSCFKIYSPCFFCRSRMIHVKIKTNLHKLKLWLRYQICKSNSLVKLYGLVLGNLVSPLWKSNGTVRFFILTLQTFQEGM